jgi:hypothetical protein
MIGQPDRAPYYFYYLQSASPQAVSPGGQRNIMKHFPSYLLLLILLPIGLSRCNPPQSKPGAGTTLHKGAFLPVNPFIDTPVNKSHYIVFKNDPVYRFEHASITTLSQREIDTIETIICRAVQTYNDHESTIKYGLIIAQLNTYYREYLPVINSKGQKEVWVNFLCHDDKDSSWKKGLVIVCDGGSCYFHLEINLATKTCYDLSVNGVA